MTATPHKGDPDHFRRFLALLDPDVYGSIKSLQQAMREHEAPFYLRRTKEALVTFPDPDTGEVRKLFTKREVRTAAFDLDGEELDFYDELTRYVEDQSMAAASDESARGRAVGFTMAMLQRRMASSVYAVRRSLERMRDRREKILDDPEAYRREQIERRVPDDFDDLTEEEQQRIIGQLEERGPVGRSGRAARGDRPAHQAHRPGQAARSPRRPDQAEQAAGGADGRGHLRRPEDEAARLHRAQGHARLPRRRRPRRPPAGQAPRMGADAHADPRRHEDRRPRHARVSRIYAEREFKESAQVLVATEAAGEGINLQFCWLMINFDIPWNPVRLEQRVGRIHRYGQEHDCLVFNFVAQNTREGRVLQKLLDRLAEIRDELGTDQVFDVVGEVFPSNLLEKLFRDMYARHDRRAQDSGPHRPRRQPRAVPGDHRSRPRRAGQEGTQPLGHRRQVGRGEGTAAGARGHRAVLRRGGPGIRPAAQGRPPTEQPCLPHRQGAAQSASRSATARKPGSAGSAASTARSSSTRRCSPTDPTLEWVTPGHPLFEAVRTDILARVDDHLRRGAVFFDLHRDRPAVLDVFAASIKDGRGNTLHRRLFVVETSAAGEMPLHEPTILHDITPAPAGTRRPERVRPPDRHAVEQFLYERALKPWVGPSCGVARPRGGARRPARRHQPERPDRPPAGAARRVPQPPGRRPDGARPRRPDRPGGTAPRRTIPHAAKSETFSNC